MGSFRPATGTRHLHRDYSFTGSLVETAAKSLRHSCRSELRVHPLFPEAQTIPSPWRLSSKGRRLIASMDCPTGRNAISHPKRMISRYGVKLRRADFPRDYPFAATTSLSAAYEEGFPVISRYLIRITPDPGKSI